LAVGPTVPCREWRELYAALDCAAVAAIHPFYTASVREFHAAGRKVVGSGPVGVEGTAAWLQSIGDAAGVSAELIGTAVDKAVAQIRGALERTPIKARLTVSGYEGSELLVARLLVEAGAEVPYVGTACPRTEWSAADRDWLEAHGTHVQYRASLEQDITAMKEVQPDLAIGTTPVVQKAKESGTPGLYFTNLISARPLFGAPGAASLAPVILGAVKGKARLDGMRSFFGDLGHGEKTGYGSDFTPRTAPARRAKAATKSDGTMMDVD